MSLVTNALTEIMSRVGIEPLNFTVDDVATTFNHSVEDAEESLLTLIKLTKSISDETNANAAYEKLNKAISELFKIKEEITALKALYDDEVPF